MLLGKKIKAISKVVIVALMLLSQPALAAVVELVKNSGLNGTVGNSQLPTDWVVGNTVASTANTPDLMDINNYAGISNYSGYATDLSESPVSGGSWLGVGRNFGRINESFSQLISGFVIGNTYTLSWYDANFGIDTQFVNYTNANRFRASIWNENDVLGNFLGESNAVDAIENWQFNSFTFTPKQTSYTLTFSLSGPRRSYLSIDDISISTQISAVPEPSSWALLLFGLVGIGFQSRVRKLLNT